MTMPKRAMPSIFASLRSGGLFLISTPIARSAHQHPPDDDFSAVGEHVREGYTEQEFHDKMTRAGFTVESMKKTYGVFWGRIAWWILQRIPMSLLTLSKALAIIVIPRMIVLYPVAAFAMWMDRLSDNKDGGGWLLLARKP